MRVKRIAIALLLALACASPGHERRATARNDETRLSALREAGTPRRVVLMTVAGLEAADFLATSGFVAGEGDPVRMPFLAALAAEGVIGEKVHPPVPESVYPAHATLVTGLRPDHHGIAADEALDPDGQRILPYWDTRLLRATTLWEAALGRGVISLGWPTTDGARIELLVPDGEPSTAHADWLADLARRSTPQLIRSLEAIADRDIAAKPRDGTGAKRTRAGWPSAGERDAAFVELACQTADSERDPALWLIRLVEPAVALASSGYRSRPHAEALARADRRIEQLVGCLSEHDRLADTALFVVGDVPHRPVHTEIAPNTVLVRENLIGRDPRSGTGIRSWLALSRSHGRSAFVYAKDAEHALAARRALEAQAERSRAFAVVPAAELAARGADRDAWFGLSARPGYAFGNALAGPLLRPAELRSVSGGLGGRDVEGGSVGMVAWGRGIRTGLRVVELAAVDVAPTIARLLGLRLEDALDGRPLIGILRASLPLPPPGPKRLRSTSPGDVDRTLREMGGGTPIGEAP